MRQWRYIRLLVLGLLYAGSVAAQLNCDRLTAIGRNALYFEDYVLSIQYFNQAIRMKPYLTEPYLLRAIAKIQLEDWEGAGADCDSVLVRNPFMANAYYTRAYVKRQLGLWTEAEQDLTEALRYAPTNRNYRSLRADVRAHVGMWAEAEQDVDELMRTDSLRPELIHEKGVLCLMRADTTSALRYMEQMTTLKPSDPAVWSTLGTLVLMQGDEERAYACLNRAVEAGSTWAGDYVNRGIIAYRRHDYRTAIADYDRAVELAPTDVRCHYNRALLLQEVGDYHRALEAYNRVVSLSPESYEMYYNRGLVYLQLMQWRKALSDMDVTLKHYPYFIPAYAVAAQCKSMLGDEAGAMQYIARADKLDCRKASDRMTPQPLTETQIVDDTPPARDRRSEFSISQAQSAREVSQEERKYESRTRGAVHEDYHDALPEPNIVLSFYAPSEVLRRTVYTHPVLEQVNHSGLLTAPLRMVVHELSLPAEILDMHFDHIRQLTLQLALAEDRGDTHEQTMRYFSRALELATVRDYASAVDDLTRAIRLSTDTMAVTPLLYLTRANMREKSEEDRQMVLRDYDQAIRLCPSLSIAYYDKGNYLLSLRDYRGAIACYTHAIELDHDFAEAYYNRGLTRVYIEEVSQGLEDLSHAGEKGIYEAYNLMKRLR